MIACRCAVSRRLLEARKRKNFFLATAFPADGMSALYLSRLASQRAGHARPFTGSGGNRGRKRQPADFLNYELSTLNFERPNCLGLNVEIINTGTELLLGRVLNTHQQWLGRQLAEHGYPVARQGTVSDRADAIRDAVKEALHRADLVITTGGLGPTSDDRTRDCVADLLSRKLYLDDAALAHIEKFFTARNRPMPATTRVQALVPEGAIVLSNAHGTAPGLAIEIAADQFGRGAKQLLVMLPGPPRELRPMFTNQVVPLLEKEFPLSTPFACRTLKTTGLGESLVEEKIAKRLQHLTAIGLEIGYCARVGEVDVRLAASGARAEGTVAGAEQIVRELLTDFIFSVEDDLLEAVVIRLLTEKKKTVSVAESCTGGLIAHRLTNVPGA